MITAIATEGRPVTRVKWIGSQNPFCAPGFTGSVMKYAHHDPASIKVWWNERNGYTWERQKNLLIESEQDA